MPYRIFLSYSWANSAERRALQLELEKITSVDVLVDATHIQPGDAIHDRIAKMIDAADCVIVMLTSEGLQSHEVLAEVIRSHIGGKFIIPVVANGATLESLPHAVRDLHWIKYDNRNFDEVVHTIVTAVNLRANPLTDPRAVVPERLKVLVNEGKRFIDVPVPNFYPGVPICPVFIYCELRMRETQQCFVFRAADSMRIGDAAAYLAAQLLPSTAGESYDWTLTRAETAPSRFARGLPEYHTFGTSGLKSGDTVYLIGKHRWPEVCPRALST